MRQTLTLVTLLTLLPTAAQAVEQAKEHTPSERIVYELEARRFRAMVEVDIPTLESILADDLDYTHTSGWWQTKAEFIGVIRSGKLKYESFDTDDVRVRVYGNTAVVTSGGSVKVKAQAQEQSFQIRYLDVYVKRQGRWQMVAWQSTRLVPE